MTPVRIWSKAELQLAKRKFNWWEPKVANNIAQSQRELLPHPACDEGCNHCCQLRVDVYPVEAARIVDYLRNSTGISAPEQRAILDRIRHNAALAATTDEKSYRDANSPCALLLGGLCRVYALRPWSCRSCFSTNSAICARTEPDDGKSTAMAGSDAVAYYGMLEDVLPVEMNQALLQYWESGKITERDDEEARKMLDHARQLLRERGELR